MIMNIIVAMTMLLLAFAFTTPLLAKSDDFSLVIKVGEEYNSNLTIEELDIESNESGILTNLELFADYKFEINSDNRLMLGYEFNQSLHDDLSEFDTQNHGFTIGYELDIYSHMFTTDYIYYDTQLDGDDLLDITFISPAFSYFLSDTTLIRFAYNYIDKQFDYLIERSAENNGGEISMYIFSDDAQSYFRWALATESEDAIFEELDFSSFKGTLSLKSMAKWLSDEAVFKASISYADREYDSITQEINAIRTETRTQFKSSLSYPFNESINFILSYEYSDRSSNLPVADYDENRVLISVEFNL